MHADEGNNLLLGVEALTPYFLLVMVFSAYICGSMDLRPLTLMIEFKSFHQKIGDEPVFLISYQIEYPRHINIHVVVDDPVAQANCGIPDRYFCIRDYAELRKARETVIGGNGRYLSQSLEHLLCLADGILYQHLN